MANNWKKYSLILFAIILGLIGEIYSQNGRIPFPSRDYFYIQYDSSKLETYQENKNLELFFNKLDELCLYGESQISVLQIGASHIQAGVWSLEMRRLFENLCPGMEGSAGLVFPYNIARTNNPYYYSTKTKGKWEHSKITDKIPKRAMGLMGIMAYTSDSIAEIDIKFNERAEIEKHKFEKITLFHNIEDSCYNIEIQPGNLIYATYVNEDIGATEFYFAEAIDSLKIIVQRKNSCDGEFCFYGAYLENFMPGINYSGIGVNGASTKSYLKAELFQDQLKAVNPDLVIFSIGVNDAAEKDFRQSDYETNYKVIADKILDVNPECAIIFTTNNDFYYYSGKFNANQEKIYGSMVKLGRHYNASVWNLYGIMGGSMSVNLWRKDDLAKRDRIHFTVEGYKLIAAIFFEAIIKEYEKHLKKRYLTEEGN